MDIGVFIPIGNNGWLISSTSPQYKPSWDLNREIVQRAERYGFDFALSMIKLRGFGGPSEHWDYNLESFTLMAGLAAVTTRIKLFATVAVLTIPPAIAARMAVTIDSISGGRFGINLVTGWQEREYAQMGLWPGDAHYDRRYAQLAEYTTVMKELWETGRSDFKGEFYQMDDCRLLPMPQGPVKLLVAAASDGGMKFASEYCDYNFCASPGGINQPANSAATVARLRAQTARTGRDVKALALTMVIADETDEAAMAKWEHYKAGTDLEALNWRSRQAAGDRKAQDYSTAGRMARPPEPLPNTGDKLIGSYATIARLLDEMSETEGLQGVMLTFDDFLVGMEQFGQRIQPLMKSRARVTRQAA